MAALAKFALVVICPLALQADRLVMRDGSEIHGRLVSSYPADTRTGEGLTIVFNDDRGTRREFDRGQVQTIYIEPAGYSSSYARPDGRMRQDNVIQGGFGDAPTAEIGRAAAPEYAQPVPPQGQPQQIYTRSSDAGVYGQQNYPAPVRSAEQPGAYARQNEFATIAAGTQFAVRTTDAIDSRSGSSGQAYSASVDRDVLDSNGNVVIPRGSDAELVITHRGDNSLALDVRSVMVNGRRYTINTDDITRTSRRDGLGENRRTAEVVGGGTALGALLGAVAGGGRGAAIGALAGAAAGAGVQVLTQGREVRVPAESVLTFRLDSDVHLMQPSGY